MPKPGVAPSAVRVVEEATRLANLSKTKKFLLKSGETTVTEALPREEDSLLVRGAEVPGVEVLVEVEAPRSGLPPLGAAPSLVMGGRISYF